MRFLHIYMGAHALSLPLKYSRIHAFILQKSPSLSPFPSLSPSPLSPPSAGDALSSRWSAPRFMPLFCKNLPPFLSLPVSSPLPSPLRPAGEPCRTSPLPTAPHRPGPRPTGNLGVSWGFQRRREVWRGFRRRGSGQCSVVRLTGHRGEKWGCKNIAQILEHFNGGDSTWGTVYMWLWFIVNNIIFYKNKYFLHLENDPYGINYIIILTHVMTKEATIWSESKWQKICSYPTERGKKDGWLIENGKARLLFTQITPVDSISLKEWQVHIQEGGTGKGSKIMWLYCAIWWNVLPPG